MASTLSLLAESFRTMRFMARKQFLVRLTVILFWMAVWSLLAACLPDLLFAGPLDTLKSLIVQAQSAAFWMSIVHSLCKIILGFLLAFACGIALSVAGYYVRPIGILLEPMIQMMKTVPVACFIVVALIWLSSANISILVAFFVVFPVVYTNLMHGLQQMDRMLIEMVQVFRVPRWKRVRALYLPQVMPYLLSSCQLGVGMAWKAGIAGEIIGLPDFSIGDQLYRAKLYLNTADLFAWTIVIIGISLICEKLVVYILKQVELHWRGTQHGNSV